MENLYEITSGKDEGFVRFSSTYSGVSFALSAGVKNEIRFAIIMTIIETFINELLSFVKKKKTNTLTYIKKVF